MTTEQYITLTRKGQITVPAEIRKALGLHIGDKVAVALDEGGSLRATLRVVPSVTDMTFGVVSINQPIDPATEDEAFMDAATQRDVRTKRASR